MKFFTTFCAFVCCSVFLLCLTVNLSHAQTDLVNKYKDKFGNLKDKSKEFDISGNIRMGSKYRFTTNQGNQFEYSTQINLNLSYMGISMPVSYRLTSGRSLIGLNSPNINIPQFKDFGLSPKYKHYTLHLGTRQMQFTPYTYNGIRFQGVGIEIMPDAGFFTKAFRGKLRSPFEEFVNLTSNQTISLSRHGFGAQAGYRSEKNEYAVSVFKAHDRQDMQSDSTIIRPKENAVVSLSLKQNLSEMLSLHFERSVSAFTKDIYSDRIDIATHTTGYNMLGLFTRRANSTYTYATKGGIDFNLESVSLGFKYEEVDPGYKTLGTIFLDNDFRSYALTYALPIKSKLFLSGEVGLRNQGIKPDSENKDNNFIGMLNASYQFSEQVNSTLMLSNLRSTQSSFATVNGLLIDSLRLTLSNKMVSATTNIIMGEKKDANLNFLASYLQSTQIREDSLLLTSKVHTSTFNVAYSKRYERLTSNYMLLYTRTITEFLSSDIVGFTTSHNYRWSETLISKHSWNSNLALNSSQKSLINLLSNSLSLVSKMNIEATLTHQLLVNLDKKVSMRDHFIELDCRYTF